MPNSRLAIFAPVTLTVVVIPAAVLLEVTTLNL